MISAHTGIIGSSDRFLSRPPMPRIRPGFIFPSAGYTVSLSDVFGAIGGLRVLREELDLVLVAVAGTCTSSPRMIRELSDRTGIPIYTTFCATART